MGRPQVGRSSKVVPEGVARLTHQASGVVSGQDRPLTPEASLRRVLWICVLFTSSTFYCIMTPIRVAILDKKGDGVPLGLVLCDLVLDIMFITNAMWTLFSLRPRGPKQEAAATWAVALGRRSLQWELFLAAVTVVPSISDIVWLAGLPVPQGLGALRLLRCTRLQPQIKAMVDLLKQSGREVNDVILRTSVMLFALILGTSFVACMYYAVSEGLSGGWISQDPVLLAYPTAITKYLRALHYAVQTLFTVGYGDGVVPLLRREMIFGIIWVLSACFLNGLVVASITSVVANMDIVSAHYRHAQDVMNRYMQIRGLPEGLRVRIKDFQAYVHLKSQSLLPDTLLAQLPHHIQAAITAERASMLSKVPFFNPQFRSQAFLLAVAERLVPRTYNPNVVIVYQHELMRELLIIRDGKVDLFTDKPLVIATLLPGDSFGECQMLLAMRHSVSARASMFTEVLALHYDALLDVLQSPRFSALCPPGGDFARAANDKGLQAAKAANVAAVLKYRKLFATLKKAKSKLQGMLATQQAEEVKWVILPSSRFHLYWDALLVIGSLYLAMAVPNRVEHQVATGMFDHYNTVMHGAQAASFWSYRMIVDYAFDAIFMLDMVLHARFIAFIEMDGGKARLVKSQEEITRHYLSSARFPLDLLCSFPYDLLGGVVAGYSAIRLPRALRACLMPAYVSQLKTHLEEVAHLRLESELYWVLKLLFATVILAQWTSTAWNILHYWASDHLRSLYWYFVTTVTVGYGDIVPSDPRETVVAIVTMILGTSFTAIIMGSIISFIAPASPTEESTQHRKTCLRAFINHNGVSPALEERISAYFDFVEGEWDGIHGDSLLEHSLPSNLRADIRSHTVCDLVLTCEFFTTRFAPPVVPLLLQRLSLCFFQRSSTIFTARDRPPGVYFVDKGTVQLKPSAEGGDGAASRAAVSPRGGQGGMGGELLSYGGFFGQHGLEEPDFVDELAPYTAKSFSNTQLWLLSKEAYERVKEDYARMHPELHATTKQQSPTAAAAADSLDVKQQRKGSKTFRRASLNMVDAAKLLGGRGGQWVPQACVLVWLVVVVYNALVIPLRIAFLEDGQYRLLSFIDYAGDVLMAATTALRFRMQRKQTEAGRVERRQNFGLDVVALLPLEAGGSWVKRVGLGPTQVRALLRLNRMLWVREVGGMVAQFERLLQQGGYKLQKDLSRLVKLVLAMLVVAHWYGCCFFLMADLAHHDGHAKTWAREQGLLRDCSLGQSRCAAPEPMRGIVHQYIVSVYWAMTTLTTTGYGDVVPTNRAEVMFGIAVVLSGVLVLASLISGLNEVVTQMDVTTTVFRQEMDHLDQYVVFRGLPQRLRLSTAAYMSALWENHKGATGAAIRRYLPPQLYQQVAMEVVGTQLESLFFLGAKGKGVLAELAACLRFELYMPEDVLFREDECAEQLRVLYEGKVELFSDVTVFTTLERCFVSEGEFFSRALQPCSACAVTIVKAAVLEFAEFWALIKRRRLEAEYLRYVAEQSEELSKLSTRSMVDKVKKNLRKQKAGKFVEDTVKKDKFWFVVPPKSLARVLWDMVGLLCLLCLLIAVPLGAAFALEQGTALTTTLYVFTVLNALDVAMRLSIFAIDLEGRVIRDPAAFRLLYLKGGFVYDFLSILPLNLLAPAVARQTGWGEEGEGALRLYWSMWLLQFLRLRKAGDYSAGIFGLLEKLLARSIPITTRRFFEILVCMIILAHIFGCLFILLSPCGSEPTPRWDCPLHNQQDIYVRALFWASYTVSTVGYGNISIPTDAIRILCVVGMVIGCVLSNAGFTAVISASSDASDREAGARHVLVSALRKFLATEMGSNAPALQSQTKDYFRYLSGELRGVNERRAWAQLSDPLRQAAVCHFAKGSLESAALFKDASKGMLASVMARLEPYLAIPGEALAKRGQPDRRLHLLQKGRCRAVDAAGHEELWGPGSLLSNLEARAAVMVHGPPAVVVKMSVGVWTEKQQRGSREMMVDVEYVGRRFRSRRNRAVGRQVRFNEDFSLKLAKGKGAVTLRVWARERFGDTLLGFAALPVLPKGGKKPPPGTQSATLGVTTEGGQASGQLSVSWSVEEEGKAHAQEWDVWAAGYCHLYSMSVDAIKELEAFVDRAANKPVLERFPGGSRGVAQAVPPPSKRDSLPTLPSIEVHAAGGQGDDAEQAGPKITVTALANAVEPPETPTWEAAQVEVKGVKALAALRTSVMLGSPKGGRLTAVISQAKQAELRMKTLVSRPSTVVNSTSVKDFHDASLIGEDAEEG